MSGMIGPDAFTSPVLTFGCKLCEINDSVVDVNHGLVSFDPSSKTYALSSYYPSVLEGGRNGKDDSHKDRRMTLMPLPIDAKQTLSFLPWISCHGWRFACVWYLLGCPMGSPAWPHSFQLHNHLTEGYCVKGWFLIGISTTCQTCQIKLADVASLDSCQSIQTPLKTLQRYSVKCRYETKTYQIKAIVQEAWWWLVRNTNPVYGDRVLQGWCVFREKLASHWFLRNVAQRINTKKVHQYPYVKNNTI